MFSFCVTVNRLFFSIEQGNEIETKHPLRRKTGFNNSSSTPSADGRCFSRYATQRFHRRDCWQSIALQRSPQRRPFGAYPTTDKHDRRDDGDQHDTEQNRILDECSAFLVVLELLDQLRRLTHVSLQCVLLHSTLSARSGAHSPSRLMSRVMQRALMGSLLKWP
jgi:hypothetical protein